MDDRDESDSDHEHIPAFPPAVFLDNAQANSDSEDYDSDYDDDGLFVPQHLPADDAIDVSDEDLDGGLIDEDFSDHNFDDSSPEDSLPRSGTPSVASVASSPQSSVSVAVVDPPPSGLRGAGRQRQQMNPLPWRHRTVAEDSSDESASGDEDFEILDIRAAERRRQRWADVQQRRASQPRVPNAQVIVLADDDEEMNRDILVAMEVEAAVTAAHAHATMPRDATRQIIDLTDDVDVDMDAGPHHNAQQAPRTRELPQHIQPRRRPAHDRRTPSLNREDGTIIDLTRDSDSDHEHHHRHLPRPHQFPRHPPGRQARYRIQPQRPNAPEILRYADVGDQYGLYRRGPPPRYYNPRHPDFALGYAAAHNAPPLYRTMAAIFNPLVGNVPDLDYRNHMHPGYIPPGVADDVIIVQPEQRPRDAYVPLPPARDGFTRQTGDEEVLAICASCDEELKFGGVEDEQVDAKIPGKKKPTRKEREEHPFWAVKACGHVYCKRCYDNRKKKAVKDRKAAPAPITNFRIRQTPGTKTAKTFCAVEGCETDVTAATAWVGLFM